MFRRADFLCTWDKIRRGGDQSADKMAVCKAVKRGQRGKEDGFLIQALPAVHCIPCSFFVNKHLVKCTVQPGCFALLRLELFLSFLETIFYFKNWQTFL
jgi:hypothetical protein